MSRSETLATLTTSRLRSHLRRGLRLTIGPFTVSFCSKDPALADCLANYYPDYPIAQSSRFADVSITLLKREWYERLFGHPRRLALEDGTAFAHFPADQLLAQVEWALNWCVAMRANYYLMLHGAVVSLGNNGMVMPGIPGAGKSTLTSYLIHRGWRLLSDEFTLIDPVTSLAQPFPRLIPLKNESIDVIASAIPEARFGPRIPNTRKGLVAHLCPDAAHIRRMNEAVQPRLFVFPRFRSGSNTNLARISPSEAFAELTHNAFNYALLGKEAFVLLSRLAEACPCYRLQYGELVDANEHLTALMEDLDISERQCP